MSVLLMYGGKSCEHDISVITGKQAAANIKKDFHEVFVSKEGKWLLADEMKNISDFSNAKNFTSDMLYSTASYKNKDLQGVGLGNLDLTEWDFSGQNLANTSFNDSTITRADFSENP